MLRICDAAPRLCKSWDSNSKPCSQLWEGLKQTPSGLEDVLKPMLNLARPSWSYSARCPGTTKGPSGSSRTALALRRAKLLPQQWLHLIAWLPESTWERQQSQRWDARWETHRRVKSISPHWQPGWSQRDTSNPAQQLEKEMQFYTGLGGNSTDRRRVRWERRVGNGAERVQGCKSAQAWEPSAGAHSRENPTSR